MDFLITTTALFVRDYGSQFKMKSDMRVIMYEEFKKYDIRIPWPIRTVYQGDEKREAQEIGQLDKNPRQKWKLYWNFESCNSSKIMYFF